MVLLDVVDLSSAEPTLLPLLLIEYRVCSVCSGYVDLYVLIYFQFSDILTVWQTLFLESEVVLICLILQLNPNLTWNKQQNHCYGLQ